MYICGLCLTSERLSVLSSPSHKLYVTLDVVFHENDMDYSVPKSSLQGENRNELQTLNYFGGNLDNSGECPNEENDDCPY